MIDRITDAGQCDYYEVIIKDIKQGLSGNCLIKGRKTNSKQHRTTDFRVRLMKEITYLIALVCDLSNINMEKKKKIFYGFAFLHSSLLRQTKESENCWEKMVQR